MLVMHGYIQIWQLPRKTTPTTFNRNIFDTGVVYHFGYAHDHLFNRAVIDVFFDTVLAGIWHFVAGVNMDLNVLMRGER